jgi:hypothetical protein
LEIIVVIIYFLLRSTVLINYVLVKLYIHGSVHRNINFIERTNKIQTCSRIYYSNNFKVRHPHCISQITEVTLYIVQPPPNPFSFVVQPDDGLLEAETCSC